MLAISSFVRLCLWPYSADQQPLHFKLHALVGSKRIIHGILQPYFSLFSLTAFVPVKPAPKPRAMPTFLSVSWSVSLIMLSPNCRQTFSGSLAPFLIASTYFSGNTRPPRVVTVSTILRKFFSGSLSMYLSILSTRTPTAACWIFSFAFIVTPKIYFVLILNIILHPHF